MNFWNLAQSEPRRAHRFLLNLPGLHGDDDSITYNQYLCKTVTKPAYTVSETEHKFLGNSYWYPGAVTWDPVTAQIVNSVDPDGNAIMMAALHSAGYMSPDQQQVAFTGNSGLRSKGPSTPNKLAALNTLGAVYIRELDGSGLVIGQWELRNPWITNVKFGDLDYSSEELLNIDITFRYDWGEYTASSAPGTLMGGPINGLEIANTNSEEEQAEES